MNEQRDMPLRGANILPCDFELTPNRLSFACDLRALRGQRVELRVHMPQLRVERVEVECRAVNPL